MPFVAPNSSGPFRSAAVELSALPKVLAEAGYTSATLAAAGLMPRRGQVELPLFEQLHRCEGGGTAELLSRLFLLALPQPAAEVARALDAFELEPLIACGLLVPNGADVRAATALVPTGDMLLARDFQSSITGEAVTEDHVLPVGLASVLAAGLTVRREGETVLDLGCGQGIQMILARRHASHLIGTDIAPRALNVAAFNLEANRESAGAVGRDVQTELRLGSFFEPVEDWRGRFDLIVSNPPFVITPSKRVVGYTSALRGDETVERVFRGAPDFLAENGWCVSLGNWHHSNPDDWPDRPRRWAGGRGCDVLIGKFETMHPRAYALKWIKGTVQEGTPTKEQVGEWMGLFDELGAGAITFGFVAMRRRTGSNWIHHEELEYDYRCGSAGDQLQRMFAGRTLLHELAQQGVGQDALLDRIVRPAPGLCINQQLQIGGAGGWRTRSMVLSQTPGMSWPLEADERIAAILAACDGTRVLRQIVRKASQHGVLEPAAAMREAAAAIRVMMERGMVEVVESPIREGR